MIIQGSQRLRKAASHHPLVLILLGPLILSSCAAAPFLVPVAFEFARNLFQTGLQNYGSKHRDNLSNLVNRLSSPYMQGLPPVQMGGPGMPGLTGPAGVPGQPGFPGQSGVPPSFPGQPGVYDPNNPYAVPGGTTYPGGTTNPYGAAQSNPAQPGVNQYDPNNPYGAATTNPYGQSTAPYGQPPNPYGGASPYGQPANPYGNPSLYPPQGPGGANPYGQTNPYGQPTPYGQTNPYGTPYQGAPNPYGGGGYDPNNPYGSGQTQAGYGQPYGHAQPGYGTQPNQQPYGGGYGAMPQPYGSQPYGAAGYGAQQPYGSAGIYPRGLGEPVAVDVALVRQKQTSKGKEVVLMNDGEVLKDGGSNPEAGDRFKIVVRLNCDCYLYIMSIDGSGWATPVFPGKDGKTPNPVKKDQEYAFPEGPQWFTLDQIKGIESFFVVGSAHRRTDLEQSFAQIGAEQRPDTKIVARVEEAPVIPRGVGSVETRGILTVKDETGTSVQVTPLSYAAEQGAQDVTVTRWFKHE